MQINVTNRVPFPQPGASTIISFGALMIWAIILLFRGSSVEAHLPPCR